MTKPPTKQEILAAHEFYADTTRATRYDPKRQWTKAHRHKERHILHFSQDQLRRFLRWRPDARRGKACRVGSETFPTVFMVDIAHQIGFQNPEDAYQALKRFVKANAWFPDRRELRWLVEYASLFPVSDTPDEAARFALHVDAQHEMEGGKPPSATSAIAAWDQEREYESLTPHLMFGLTGDSAWRWRARTDDRDANDGTTTADALRFARATLRILDECTNREHGTTFAQHVLGKPIKTHIRNPLAQIATIDVRKSPRRITTYPAERITAYRRLVDNAYGLTTPPIDEAWGWHPHAPEPDPDLPQGAVKQLQEAGLAIHADIHARMRDSVPSRTTARKSAPARRRSAKRLRAPHPRTTPTTPPRPQVRVTVNSARLEELEIRSATLRERLIPDEHLRSDAPAVEPTAAPTGTAAGGEVEETTTRHPLIVVEEAEYQALLEGLTGHEREAVAALLENHVASLERVAKAAGLPVTLLVDRVNEKALDAIGDVLIDTAGGTPVVFEEHAEVLVPSRHENHA